MILTPEYDDNTCPHCGKNFTVEQPRVGETEGRCPHCNKKIYVSCYWDIKILSAE